MSEIEAKRKELEENIFKADGNGEGSFISDRDFEEHFLEGFNLGIEMARKEFLEWLENNIDSRDYDCNETRDEKIKELKQSLEERNEK